MNGVRGRTAIGVKKDGTVVIYVSKDGQSGSYGACTIETLQQRMLALGCYTALNLDGGGSSQYESDTDKITSSRRVHNYICIWLNKEEKKPVAPAKPVVQV
jgi:exopolysaccharide biosynthesis protein